MTDKAATGSAFDALLGEINGLGDQMSKALVDEGEGLVHHHRLAGEGEGGAAGEGEGDGELDADGKPVMMNKAFTFVDAAGAEHEGIDATELLKSLVGSVKATDSKLETGFQAMLGVVQKQGEMIKSLVGTVAGLQTGGVGRKAVLTVHDKTTPAAATDLVKSENEGGLTVDQFWGKAMEANKRGAISAADVSLLESRIQLRQELPAHLLARIEANS
jgi:hypothetical protein